MSKMIALQCPTCGARLEVAENKSQFTCNHCGNAYLLEKTAGDIPSAERERLSPRTIFAHQIRQWLRVGNYEIFVHSISEEKENNRRMIFVDVEYRNPSDETLTCRRNQWISYDEQGFTYDVATETAPFEKRARPPLTGERFANPGMKVRGWIMFYVPQSARLERLQFITGFLAPKSAEFMLGTT